MCYSGDDEGARAPVGKTDTARDWSFARGRRACARGEGAWERVGALRGMARRPAHHPPEAQRLAPRGGRAFVDFFVIERFHQEPAVGIEPTTARLRIECSTTELRWRYALERTRTATPFGTTPSRWRVYQFHHQGPAPACIVTGLTGIEPATSGVTDRHSNQAELQPQIVHLDAYPTSPSFPPCFPHSPKGNRTPLCTLKECRPNR